MTERNPSNDGEGPQAGIDHLNQFTDVVSLSMGGNDIGFGDIAALCVLADCGTVDGVGALAAGMWDVDSFFYTRFKTIFDAVDACANPADVADKLACYYKAHKAIKAASEVKNDTDRIATPLYVYNDVLHDRLVAMYRRIAEQAPNAHVFVQLYPQIADTSAHGTACKPLPGFSFAFTGDERDAISSIINQLNADISQAVEDGNSALRAAAGRGGFKVVDPASEFAGHELCRDGYPNLLNPDSYFNSLVIPDITDIGVSTAYSFHPNALGQRAYERALAAEIKHDIESKVLDVQPKEAVDAGSVFVPYGARTLQSTSAWHGSTVTMSLISPTGERFDAGSSGVRSGSTATSQWLELDDPSPGTWHVHVFGDDLPAGGELVQVSAFATQVPPAPPTVDTHVGAVDGATNTFELHASGPAGATFRWAFSDGSTDEGADVRHEFTNDGALWATLHTIASDGGESWTSIDVRPAQPDTTPPVIHDVPDDQRTEATGPTGAKVTYTPPTAEDDRDGAVSVSCEPGSGSMFPVGTTTVTCSASDTAGNKASASFKVTVIDTTPPVISNVPAAIAQDATGASGAVVTYRTPTASDLVEGTVDVTCDPASGTTFAIGTSIVTCRAADTAGNSATATFKVTVAPPDTTPPTITVPADMTAEATGPDGARATYTASATDPDDSVTAFACAPATGATFALGTTTVRCTASDSHGNDATASFKVTVKDTTPPRITSVPTDITVNATKPSGAVVIYAPPKASDLVDGAVSIACASTSGSTYPIATTKVVCTATDSHGNSASATFTVTVLGARAQIRNLEDEVSGSSSLAHSPLVKKTLLKELDAADDDLARDHRRSACMDMARFLDSVKRLTKPKGPIATSESADWLAAGDRISAVIGCPTKGHPRRFARSAASSTKR